MRSIIYKPFALIALSLVVLHTSSSAQPAQQVLKNVKQKFDQVKDYTVTVNATVNMERMKVPPMNATLYFKQPDKIHVESKNFAMLPKEAMGLTPLDMITKFDATLMKSEKRNGTMFYDLRLVSKPEKGKPVREFFVTINGDIWAVSHIESFPMPGRKISVDFTHALVADQYWLPSSMTVNYTSEQVEDSQQDQQPPQNPGGNTRRGGMPRSGTANVRYTDYKVNTGLSDAIFEKKKEDKKEEKK